MRKRENGKIKKSIVNALEVPGEMFSSLSGIHITSDSEVRINGCRAILVYESEIIELSLTDMDVGIEGHGLSLKSYFGSHICVKGKIKSINLK